MPNFLQLPQPVTVCCQKSLYCNLLKGKQLSGWKSVFLLELLRLRKSEVISNVSCFIDQFPHPTHNDRTLYLLFDEVHVCRLLWSNFWSSNQLNGYYKKWQHSHNKNGSLVGCLPPLFFPICYAETKAIFDYRKIEWMLDVGFSKVKTDYKP